MDIHCLANQHKGNAMLNKIIGFMFYLVITSAYAFQPPTIYLAPGLTYDRIRNEAGTVVFQGLEPRVAVGIGDFKVGMFYFALEGFVNPIKPMSINNRGIQQGDEILTFQTSTNYGGSLLFGWHLDDIVKIYSRFGAAYTRFKDFGKRKCGAQLGLGIEAIISGPWSFRLDYTRTFYRRFSDLSEEPFSDVDTPFNDSGTFSVLFYFG